MYCVYLIWRILALFMLRKVHTALVRDQVYMLWQRAHKHIWTEKLGNSALSHCANTSCTILPEA